MPFPILSKAEGVDQPRPENPFFDPEIDIDCP
jgi:hypothetical protein